MSSRLSQIVEIKGADFVVSAGDNFYNEGVKDLNDPKFETVFNAVYSQPSLQIPWYVVLETEDPM